MLLLTPHLGDSKELKDKTYQGKDSGSWEAKLRSEEVENQADWFQGAGPLEGSGSGDTKVLLRSREHLGMEMGLLIESLYKQLLGNPFIYPSIHSPTNPSIRPINHVLRFLPYPIQQCDYFPPNLNQRLEFYLLEKLI